MCRKRRGGRGRGDVKEGEGDKYSSVAHVDVVLSLALMFF
jgi:hypothetical protein